MSKERPILFSGPMIRAILEGRKTQTRRIVKWSYGPNGTPLTPIDQIDQFADIVQGLSENLSGNPVPFCESKSPYGVPGDRLWVREKFGAFKESSKECSPSEATYVVLEDGTQVYRDGSIYPGLSSYNEGAFWFKWRSSFHMPRWASRISLRVTGVRVERLQDIQPIDAIDEGAMTLPNRPTYEAECQALKDAGVIKPPLGDGPVKRFARLWESINGEGSWDTNPWVWVIEFKRIAQAVAT